MISNTIAAKNPDLESGVVANANGNGEEGVEQTPTEVSPLLSTTNDVNITSNIKDNQENGVFTYTGNNRHPHHDHDDDDDDDTQSVLVKMAKRPFWWFCILGILAFIVFELSFLPRTSTSRDYRRWYGLKLTKSDVKRHFLLFSGIGESHNSITTEQYINNWLTNFTEINQQQSSNLISDENIALTSFVEKNFKQFGFKVQSLNYDLPSTFEKSIDSKLQLIDNKGQLIYNANLIESKNLKTPSYYIWGHNGSIKQDYLFVNEGLLQDYVLLKSQNIVLDNKIVIVKTNWENSSTISISEKIQIAKSFNVGGFINYYDFNSITKNNKEIEIKKLNQIISRDNGAKFTDINSNQVEFNWEKPDIPAIPISFKSIKPILDTLSNEKKDSSVFSQWDYYPVNFDNSIKLQLQTNFKPLSSSASSHSNPKLTNIIASIDGILNDGDIVIGARRDSSTSSNPLSNHAILFEIMRNYQRLVSIGWKPLRNIKFISWDGSNSGLLGSYLYTNDTEHFNNKKSILAYINIDGDAVTGSKFHIDSHPFFNHVLKKTSKFIPIPKTATAFKTLADEFDPFYDINSIEDDEDDYDDDEDDDNEIDNDEDDYSTLHHYWSKQDNKTINGVLGQDLIKSDALIFQNHLNTPIINVRFENDPKRDSSLHIPNSNYYSYDWLVKRQIDEDLLLHGSLIRYIGLLAITLSEHEVVDYRTRYYAKTIGDSFEVFLQYNKQALDGWSNRNVSTYLISKSNIFKDFKNQFDADVDTITFNDLIFQFQSLLTDLFEYSFKFDTNSKALQNDLTKDYPWYRFYKKVQTFASFKVFNHILLHLERNGQMTNNEYQYLNLSHEYYFQHAFYGVPKFNASTSSLEYLKSRSKLSTFTHLHESVLDNDFEATIKWLVVIYDKLKF
ncbi:vacuolar targeting protein [Scheffersomyces coipomensis]|uniref:vacuolar targeting protein n=1 Tax=Scheffersomyces coipomensis TaxID=1788519 RepID=UPI00315D1C53